MLRIVRGDEVRICDERCRCQPKGVSPRIPQPGSRKCCWLRLWIVLRLWMSGFQLLGTLRNKLLCALGRLRQQLRLGLRACEIRLRRTVRTDFLLRVPAALVWVICAAPACRPKEKHASARRYSWREARLNGTRVAKSLGIETGTVQRIARELV